MAEKRDGKEEEIYCMDCGDDVYLDFIKTNAKKEDFWKCPECGMIHHFKEDGDVILKQG